MKIAIGLALCLGFANSSLLAQEVSAAQRAKYPCLDKVAGSAEGAVIARADIPKDFQGLAPIYVGHWNEPDGSKVCSALLFQSIGGRGQGGVTYTNDEPYKRMHALAVSVKRDGDRISMDVYHRSQGWSIDYLSEDGGKTFVMRPGAGSRGPAKTGDLVAVE